MTSLPPPSGDMEKPRFLSDEEAKALERLFNAWNVYQRPADDATVIKYIPALLSDREARIQQNRAGIEKMFAAMNKLDTPKRGELHLLLISLFS